MDVVMTNIIKSYELANSTLRFPYSLMYHYSPIDLQKKHQYPRGFFRIHIIRNLMVNENKALVFIFPKKIFFKKKIIFS